MGEEGLTRRVVLRDGSAVAIVVMLTGPASSLAEIAVPVRSGKPSFLNAAEMAALRGLIDHFIPGKPIDLDDGALAAGCAEAIDALLGAFEADPPRIYAGAPFSDRSGSKVNHFKRFLQLDDYEEMAWRLRIKGSRGRRSLEFNGPVAGWQQTYREGLAALDEAAGGQGFGAASPIARELILKANESGAIGALVDIAFPHAYQFMYGAPEYGGNKGLIGWRYTNYDGDVQPRGWSRAEIEELDSDATAAAGLEGLAELGIPLAELGALAALGFPDAAHHIVARGGDSLRGLREQVRPVIDWAKRGGLDGA